MRLLSQNALRVGVATVTMVALSAGVMHADSVLEYRVKSAFLYNFAKFVEWPAGTFSSDGEPIDLCLVGEDPFGKTLGDTLKGRTVNGRAVRLQRVESVGSRGRCHIVFIGKMTDERLARAMHRAAATGALTVGESRAFYDLGGIIRLLVENGKVRFDVNAAEAAAAGLKVSSQLLKLARTVRR